jgi:putative addiction module killer protein
MIEVRQTACFEVWLDDLADGRAASRIAQRIIRLRNGLFGDVRPVGGGVSELRVDYGPGYRVYFVRRGAVLVILLCGGDKRSQPRDIAKAKLLAAGLENNYESDKEV